MRGNELLVLPSIDIDIGKKAPVPALPICATE